MSLERYAELSKQEQRHPTNFLTRFANTLGAILTFWTPTPLEQLLLTDDETFTTPLTKKYAQIEHFEGVGEVHSVIIPHPLKTSLNNNTTMSVKVMEEVQYEVDHTPVILFLHGLGGNLQQFDDQIKTFAALTDVVALDLPGSGKSKWDSKRFKLTLDNFAELIETFLQRHGFKKRKLIVISHSYGTQVTLKLLNLLPSERIVGVSLIAPPKLLFKRAWYQSLVLKFLLHVPIVFSCFRKIDRLNNLDSVSLKRLFADTGQIDDYHKFKQFKFNLSSHSGAILTQLLSWKQLTAQDIIEAHQRLTAPGQDGDTPSGSLLIIDGAKDKITHNGGESYKDLLGSHCVQYVVVEGAGHNLMLETVDKLNGILLKFAGTCDSRLGVGHLDEVKNRLAAA